MTVAKQHVCPATLTRCRMPAEALLAKLLERRFVDACGPVLVAVGGPGGTGKSTFCRALAERLPDAAIFRMDEYKTPRAERKKKRISGPHPEANDMALLTKHLEAMKADETFDMPRYDAGPGAANGSAPYAPARFNLLDGEVATYADFGHLVDLALYLDAHWTTQLLTRVTRDIAERGHSREKVIETFLRSNLREFPEHGAPTKHASDIHLFRHEDHRIAVDSVAEELVGAVDAILMEDSEGVALDGLVVPITTPFDAEGRVDEDAFAMHLDFLAEHGVGRILIGGTTGEFFSLECAERRRLFVIARRRYEGALFFHVSDGCLASTRDNACWAQDHGADALLALPPIYPAGLGEAGLVAYFAALAEVCAAPLVLYDFPRHAKNAIPAAALDAVPHYGVKDSGGTGAFLGRTPHYYTARDDVIVEFHARGACGFYSGAANFAPGAYVALERALDGGDAPRVTELEAQAMQLAARCADNPIPAIKAALAEALPGYPPHVRLPLEKYK